MENNSSQIKWRTKSKYVDLETGEEITPEIAKRNYTITKKTKKSNVYKTTGTTTIINECRRTYQRELPFDQA